MMPNTPISPAGKLQKPLLSVVLLLGGKGLFHFQCLCPTPKQKELMSNGGSRKCGDRSHTVRQHCLPPPSKPLQGTGEWKWAWWAALLPHELSARQAAVGATEWLAAEHLVKCSHSSSELLICVSALLLRKGAAVSLVAFCYGKNKRDCNTPSAHTWLKMLKFPGHQLLASRIKNLSLVKK